MTEVVTMRDVRLAGYCVRGLRRWCESQGFDFRDALQNGIPESDIIKLGDADGLLIVARKREREERPPVNEAPAPSNEARNGGR